jgi:cardiolipin synthase A/B
MHVFGDDWMFTTGERLDGDAWFPPKLRSAGTTLARAIPDGPDEHFEALKVMLMGALAQARRSIAVVTPYFLPDQSLIHALNTAALKGIDVDIVLPEQGNLKPVQWAAHAQYWQVLERGCRIWHTPPPFDHSKLLLVDAEWALVGSTNWDARSLRLNFELNVECYDAVLGAALRQWFERRRVAARPVTLDDANGRPLPVRLRDGAARLLTPYL